MDTLKHKMCVDQSHSLMLMLDTDFNIVAVSGAYLRAVCMKMDTVLGLNIFEVFPDSLTADEEYKIRASLNRVIETKMDDSLLLIKYTMPKEPSQGRGFITKYWRAYYSPILNDLKEVEYIMLLLEDVTNQ